MRLYIIRHADPNYVNDIGLGDLAHLQGTPIGEARVPVGIKANYE